MLSDPQDLPSSSTDPNPTSFLLSSLSANSFFLQLPFPSSTLLQLSHQPSLTPTTFPTSTSLPLPLDFQLLFLLSGTIHLYIPTNSWPNTLKNHPTKLHPHKQLLLFKKITQNQYYLNYEIKYEENRGKKMQLVVEEGAKVVFVRDEVYGRYFEKRVRGWVKEMVEVLERFDFMKGWRGEMMYEVAKEVREEKLGEGSVLYEKGAVSDWFYFIKQGTVELYETKRRKPLLPSKSSSSSPSHHHPSPPKPNTNNKFTNLHTLLVTKNKVVGLDGIITSTEGNRRMFTCEAISNVEVLKIERRVLIMLICLNREKDLASKVYHEVNLGEQFEHQREGKGRGGGKREEGSLGKMQLKQTGYNNFRSKTRSIVDVLRGEGQMPRIGNREEKGREKSKEKEKERQKEYQSTELISIQKRAYQTTSQFLPQSRISIIRMGQQHDNPTPSSSHLFQPYRYAQQLFLPPPHPHSQLSPSHPTSPRRRSLPPKKRSLTLLRSPSHPSVTKSRYRHQYHKQMQQLIEIKRLQEQNAKIKLVSQHKFDERLKSTSRIKRILICSKVTGGQSQEEGLFRKLEALDRNPLLLNFESNRKRVLLQMKKSVGREK